MLFTCNTAIVSEIPGALKKRMKQKALSLPLRLMGNVIKREMQGHLCCLLAMSYVNTVDKVAGRRCWRYACKKWVSQRLREGGHESRDGFEIEIVLQHYVKGNTLRGLMGLRAIKMSIAPHFRLHQGLSFTLFAGPTKYQEVKGQDEKMETYSVYPEIFHLILWPALNYLQLSYAGGEMTFHCRRQTHIQLNVHAYTWINILSGLGPKEYLLWPQCYQCLSI